MEIGYWTRQHVWTPSPSFLSRRTGIFHPSLDYCHLCAFLQRRAMSLLHREPWRPLWTGSACPCCTVGSVWLSRRTLQWSSLSPGKGETTQADHLWQPSQNSHQKYLKQLVGKDDKLWFHTNLSPWAPSIIPHTVDGRGCRLLSGCSIFSQRSSLELQNNSFLWGQNQVCFKLH